MTTANKFYNVLDAYGIEQAIIQGKDWYPEAWRICREFSHIWNITPERVAAIMAVTSPRARWSKNVDATYMIIEDSFKPKHKRRPYYGILNANARKGFVVANDRYYSRHVTGPKVSNFYANIIGHTDLITVDSIMSKAAGYGSDVSQRIRDDVERGVRVLAETFNTNNRDMQAAIWIAYRGSAS